MKKIILFFLLSGIFYAQSDGFVGDWRIQAKGNNSNDEVLVKIEIVSFVFEGINNYNHRYRIYNRFNDPGEIYNGVTHRLFDSSSNHYVEYPLQEHSQLTTGTTQNDMDMCHTGGGELKDTPLAWGFAKYKVTIKVANEKYTCYFNCLDSKYGKDSYEGRNIYGADFSIRYVNTRPLNHRVILLGTLYGYDEVIIDSVATWDTLSNGQPSKEFKVWEILYPNKPNPGQPWERNFKARTTPFPIHPDLLFQSTKYRQLIIGTTVTFDTVYDYLGDLDRYGYNTVINYWYTDYYSNPPITPGYNDLGNTYCTPVMAYSFETFGIRITAINGDSVIIAKNKKLWISGLQAYNNKGDTIIFSSGSALIKKENSQINTCNGGCFSDSGANNSWASGSFHRAFENSEIGYYGNADTINNGGHIEIMANATLKVGDNTTLTFDGAGTYLKLNPKSIVKLGHNAKIQIRNGATINADSCSFNKLGSIYADYAIVFDNPGANNTVSNCTFDNILKPLSGRNVFSLTCHHNDFNLGSTNGIGILFQNFAAESGSLPYNLNITSNKFLNGYIGIFLGGYASDNVIAYIDHDTIISNTGGWGIALKKCNGNVKNSYIKTNSINYGLGLWNSNPNLYKNYIWNNNSQANLGNSVYLAVSNPLMTPIKVQNQGNQQYQFYWLAGSNKLYSDNKDNIHFTYSKPVLDHGENYFTKSNSAQTYHLYGNVSGNSTTYYARDNCWVGNGNSPKYHLSITNDTPVTLIAQSNINCTTGIAYTGYDLFQIGDYYDTVFISEDYTGDSIPDDEALYSHGAQQILNQEYVESILTLKNLLDNYIYSQYRYTAVSDLYCNYERIDTSNQNHTDFIFSELKNYLNNKIIQYQFDLSFVDIAYNYVLMCESRIQNYNDALTGYEFISLYHPDPEQRLLASMDYGYIQELLNGAGGMSSQSKMKKQVNILKLMDKNPVSKIVKKAYEKMERQKSLASKKETRRTLFKSDMRSKELIERAKFNIYSASSLNSQQRDERRM
ncbi:MAG: hypothetical protein EHM58_16305 [Ignavibacteriae bacterium]|nr:MAG: hypothetical protein EHM58_16305 [Ignavibacteriota bacterium]